MVVKGLMEVAQMGLALARGPVTVVPGEVEAQPPPPTTIKHNRSGVVSGT